jgi:hypothetical protein
MFIWNCRQEVNCWILFLWNSNSVIHSYSCCSLWSPSLMHSLYLEIEVVLYLVNIPNERGTRGCLTQVREAMFLRDSAPYGVKGNTGFGESDCLKFNKGLSFESYINIHLVQRSVSRPSRLLLHCGVWNYFDVSHERVELRKHSDSFKHISYYNVWAVCVTYRWVLDWMIGIIDTLCIQLVTTINYSVIVIPTIYRSLLHTPVSSVFTGHILNSVILVRKRLTDRAIAACRRS